MNIFGVGLPEIAVIAALALIIFGPKRLPELGRTLGKTLKGLQTASNEFEKEIEKAMSNQESTQKEISTDLSNNEKGNSIEKGSDEVTESINR